jgi:hypothetical protein
MTISPTNPPPSIADWGSNLVSDSDVQFSLPPNQVSCWNGSQYKYTVTLSQAMTISEVQIISVKSAYPLVPMKVNLIDAAGTV